MQKQRDDSVRDCVLQQGTCERCWEGREISIRDGSQPGEGTYFQKGQEKGEVPSGIRKEGLPCSAGITQGVQGAELCSQLCYTTAELPSPLPFTPSPPWFIWQVQLQGLGRAEQGWPRTGWELWDGRFGRAGWTNICQGWLRHSGSCLWAGPSKIWDF